MATDWSQFTPLESDSRRPSGGVDWTQFEPVKRDESDFTRGVKESFQQLPQLGYGLMAGAGAAGESMFGRGGIWSGIKKAGVQGYTDWGDKIALNAKESDSWSYSWDQAKQGNFGALVDWLQHGIGYAGGQAIQMLATAGIGSAVGKLTLGTAAEKIAEGMVRKEAARLAEGAAVTPEIMAAATSSVASKIGQTVAMGATATGMEGGEIFGDLAKRSQEEGRALSGSELGQAFFATIAAGGLEFVGDKVGLDLMLGKSRVFRPAQSATGMGGRAARGALGAAAAVPTEAGTEYFQTGLENWGKGEEQGMVPWLQSQKAQRDALDAAALGGLGGAVMGGAGGALQGPRPRLDPITEIGAAQSVDEATRAFEQAVKVDKAPTLPDLPPLSEQDANRALMGIETPVRKDAHENLSTLWPWMGSTPETDNTSAFFQEVRRQYDADRAAIAAEQQWQETDRRRAEIMAQPVERAERRRSDAVEMQPADPVQGYVDQQRQVNTPAARAFVQEFEAGRITRDDVAQRMEREQPKTDAEVADQRLAAAAAQAPKQQGDGLLLTADGYPYGTRAGATARATREGGTVVEVAGGFAVRPKETASAQPDVASAAADVDRAGAAPPSDLDGGERAVRPVADDALRGPADGAPAAVESGGLPVQRGSAGGAGAALTPGATFELGGKTWTVTETSDRVVKAKDAEGATKMIAVGSKTWDAITSSARTEVRGKSPDAAAPVSTQAPAQAGATVAAAPDDDYITKLFGTPEEQAAAQARFMADADSKKRDLEGVRTLIAEQRQRAQGEHDDWSGRVYKKNKTQVDLRGDGPSNQASMSIGSINESRRRNALDALSQELGAIDKLDKAMATDDGAARVMGNLRAVYEQAKKIAEAGNGLFKSADQQFEYMLLDELKVRGPGGRGNVTSNGLSKAALRLVKGEAPPKKQEAPAAAPSESAAPQREGEPDGQGQGQGEGRGRQEVLNPAAAADQPAAAPEPSRATIELRKRVAVLNKLLLCMAQGT